MASNIPQAQLSSSFSRGPKPFRAPERAQAPTTSNANPTLSQYGLQTPGEGSYGAYGSPSRYESPLSDPAPSVTKVIPSTKMPTPAASFNGPLPNNSALDSSGKSIYASPFGPGTVTNQDVLQRGPWANVMSSNTPLPPTVPVVNQEPVKPMQVEFTQNALSTPTTYTQPSNVELNPSAVPTKPNTLEFDTTPFATDAEYKKVLEPLQKEAKAPAIEPEETAQTTRQKDPFDPSDTIKATEDLYAAQDAMSKQAFSDRQTDMALRAGQVASGAAIDNANERARSLTQSSGYTGRPVRRRPNGVI